jgi:hypothetical protein
VLLGGVAAGLVFLSVYHLTCAVSTLTGSPLLLAVLLAVGIDLGLVASEVAEMIAEDNVVQKWSKGYLALATILSMVLNSYEFAAHAPDNWFSKALSVGFGLVLPVMIFVLARQAGGKTPQQKSPDFLRSFRIVAIRLLLLIRTWTTARTATGIYRWAGAH